jgi:hypothetical protein
MASNPQAKQIRQIRNETRQDRHGGFRDRKAAGQEASAKERPLIS